ncbi:MAG TPA: hypothetical protein VHZ54_17605 [Solirubrobacterales bacterium]|jgi:hypothetical protein|nr:hypothetical protein [Solirubrobacterales bacterium]
MFMNGVRSRKTKRRGAMAAVLLVALAALGLLSAGSASAASRGFSLHNLSRADLKLESVMQVPTGLCSPNEHCVKPLYPMAFEGRPDVGSEIEPDAWEIFDLKYGFNPLGGIQYAADIVYRVVGTDATVEYKIYVWSTANTSGCKVHGSAKYSCTATDTRLTFKDER